MYVGWGHISVQNLHKYVFRNKQGNLRRTLPEKKPKLKCVQLAVQYRCHGVDLTEVVGKNTLLETTAAVAGGTHLTPGFNVLL